MRTHEDIKNQVQLEALRANFIRSIGREYFRLLQVRQEFQKQEDFDAGSSMLLVYSYARAQQECVLNALLHSTRHTGIRFRELRKLFKRTREQFTEGGWGYVAVPRRAGLAVTRDRSPDRKNSRSLEGQPGRGR